MLVNLRDILKIASAKRCAVGSFNTPNLESVMAVIGAAESLPVSYTHLDVYKRQNLSRLFKLLRCKTCHVEDVHLMISFPVVNLV